MQHFSNALIAGGNGQLSRALASSAPDDTQAHLMPRTELDIADETSIRAAFERIQPDIVFNGAAYNLVDRAQNEGMNDCWNFNALGPSRLAQICAEREIPLVHFSTDFVFDGTKTSPYEESDCPRPLSVYGSAKLGGENAVIATHPRNFAIRVCRLFGPVGTLAAGGKPAGNFPLLMLKLGRERDSVRVVSDQIGTPTYTPDLASAVWQLVQKAPGGLYHLSNAGEVGFDDYARTIFEIGGVDCTVESVSSAEYGAPAARPAYSTLSNEKAQDFGVAPLRDWRAALEEFLSEQG